MEDKHLMGERFGASVKSGSALQSGVGVKGRWEVECRDKDGNLKWTDHIDNLVTNEGLNHLLDATLSGATQITTWYVGLTDGTPTAAAADTLASHSGWTEISDYADDRKAWTDGGVSSQSVTNSASAAEFAINDTATIGGAFLASAASGTTGTLYAVGAFSGGDKALGNGDTLTVTATFTAAAA